MAEKMFNSKISYGLVILSGILLLLSYPPFKFGGFLAWFALVPAIVAIYYETNPKRSNRFLNIVGLCISPVFLWIAYDPMFIFSKFLGIPLIVAQIIAIAAAVGVAVFMVGPICNHCFSKKVRRNLAYLPSKWAVFALPIGATTFEFLLLNIPVLMKIGSIAGFFSLSRTQWLNPPILELASFTGMYGVTFLVWMVNAVLAYGVVKYIKNKQIPKETLAIIALLAAIFVFGWLSIPEVKSGDTTVVLIQVRPEIMETEHINELYINLSRESLKYNPEIIFWPIWAQSFKEFDPSKKLVMGPFVEKYADFAQENNIYLTDGQKIVFPSGNTATFDYPFHYMHLLPIQGNNPFALDKIFPESHGFDARSGRFGLLGCIEAGSTLPTNKLVDDGVRFVIAATGNAPLFMDEAPALFRASIVYRAVENRIYAAFPYRDRCSVIIDPYGRLVEDIAPEPEIVAGTISFTDERTFYSEYGDLFGWTIVGLMIILTIYNNRLKRKSLFKYCEWCGVQLAKDMEKCSKCGKKPEKSWWRKITG